MDPGRGIEPRPPGSEPGVLPVRPSRIGRSVEERDVPHRPRALLGVRQHAVPGREHDGVVVRVTDGAFRVQLRVANHLPPRPHAGDRHRVPPPAGARPWRPPRRRRPPPTPGSPLRTSALVAPAQALALLASVPYEQQQTAVVLVASTTSAEPATTRSSKNSPRRSVLTSIRAA